MTIRAFEQQDRDAVLAMADRLEVGVAPWRDPAKVRSAVRRWVTGSLSDADEGAAGSALLVAEQGGAVVGFVAVAEQPHWSGDRDGYIGELVVREDCEGQGLGRSLVTAAQDWAASRGLSRIRLETGARNAGALHLYESLGYEREDVTLSRPLGPVTESIEE